MACILVVDPNPLIREATVRALTRARMGVVVEAINWEEAVEVAETILHLDLVISELDVPSRKLSCMDLVRTLRKQRPGLPIIFAVSGKSLSEFAFKAPARLNNIQFLERPWPLDDLMGAIHDMLRPVADSRARA